MEIEPDSAAESNGQVLEQALGDEAQLDVALIGRQLAAKSLAVTLGLAMGCCEPSPRRMGFMFSIQK